MRGVSHDHAERGGGQCEILLWSRSGSIALYSIYRYMSCTLYGLGYVICKEVNEANAYTLYHMHVTEGRGSVWRWPYYIHCTS